MLAGIVGGVAVASLAPACVGVAAAAEVRASDVAPGLTVLSGAGGNIAVLSTSAGQVVVDSGAAASSRAGSLAALGDRRAVASPRSSTRHWHLDQVGANEALGTAGATIVAHEKTRQRCSAGWYVPARRTLRDAVAPRGAADEDLLHRLRRRKSAMQRIEYRLPDRGAHRRRHLRARSRS